MIAITEKDKKYTAKCECKSCENYEMYDHYTLEERHQRVWGCSSLVNEYDAKEAAENLLHDKNWDLFDDGSIYCIECIEKFHNNEALRYFRKVITEMVDRKIKDLRIR